MRHFSFTRLWPRSLLGRLSLVMLAGVLFTQLAVDLIWASQLHSSAEQEIRVSSAQLAHSANETAHFFMGLPDHYRPIVIQQFRKMGGTRFFVTLNSGPVDVDKIEPHRLTGIAIDNVSRLIRQELPSVKAWRVDFAWPDHLKVDTSGSTVADLPETWVQNILMLSSKPAPVLVIQLEMEPGHWIYLASLMPNPYFLDSSNFLPYDRLLLQVFSLATVLVLSLMVVRWTTRPLAALSEAAEAFGNGEHMPELPQTGSSEFINTAQAFSAMRTRIQRYIEDRERLFVSISHDLRTPIMRLKLRAELLDNDAQRQEFHEDLDELDMMVKGALQCVKDKDIHENPTRVNLDALIDRMIRGTQLAGHEVRFDHSGLSVVCKPLALKRALGNLLDNALYYGERVEISAHRSGPRIAIQLRDHGPGVPQEAFDVLFQPYVRLEHARQSNKTGMGLGLSIAKDIVESLGGELQLMNHPEGGLQATVYLPA